MFDKLKERLKKKKKHQDGGIPSAPSNSDGECVVKVRGTCIKSPKAMQDGGVAKKEKC